VEPLGAPDEKVGQARAGPAGLVPEGFLPDRNVPHPEEGEATSCEDPLDDAEGFVSPSAILGQEQEAGRQAARGRLGSPLAGQVLGEHGAGDLGDDAGPVACLAIGIHGAPVGEAPESLERERQDVAPGTGREVGHEADAAGIVVEEAKVHVTVYGRRTHK
jgi:hypothetical protein